MKKILCLVLALALLLVGCDTADTSSENSSDVSEPVSSNINETSYAETSSEASSADIGVFLPSAKFKLAGKEGTVEECTADEAEKYLKTDEALQLAAHFGVCINDVAFDEPSELMGKTSHAFFWFIQATMYDVGTVNYDLSQVAVSENIANGFLSKYFGIENFDSNKSSFFDKRSGKYLFPDATEGSMWGIKQIELESVEGNVCTYKLVYFYVSDEMDGPYWGARLTFKVMKDGEKPFLQVVSNKDVLKKVATLEKIIAQLG